MIDLDILITSRVRRKIVVFFVTYPAIKMHVRGLAKLIKEDPGNIQRELAKLEKAGFIAKEKKKNTFVYYANTDFLFFKELQEKCPGILSFPGQTLLKIANIGLIFSFKFCNVIYTSKISSLLPRPWDRP